MEIENVQDGRDDVERGGSCHEGVRRGSSSGPEAGLAPSKNEREMWLAWEDLSVLLPRHGFGHAKKLLSGLNGYAKPGRLVAIMGPSGSGKSTLLDALAGRLSGNVVMTGNVLFNGKKKANPGGIAYVTQNDVLLGTLTVRETIAYSAELRLPSPMTKEEISSIVDGTIEEMGLHYCADRVIGNWHLRGISGGEKKRLSIALEILTRPTLLFLDEPTSGLDSASSFFVVNTIRNIAHSGRTVLSSIHQPSSEVFALFDDLYLLSGGETVYFGGTKMAIEFFAEAGFPCPSYRNPSDHFLCCINTDFDNVSSFIKSRRVRDQELLAPPAYLRTEEVRGLLVEKYWTSKYASEARVWVKNISNMEDLAVGRIKGSKATWNKQLSTLTRRSFVNMSRDLGYYWLRIVIYIAVSLCVGTIFFHVGTSYPAIWARGSCGAFVAGFMTFMSIGGFPSFIEEMKVFYHERFNQHYGISVYVLSNFLSSFPFLFGMSIVTATIIFYMVNSPPKFYQYVYACLDLLSTIAVVESCMLVIASMVPNFLMGVLLGAAYLGIMMMTAGYFRFLPDLPKPFWRYPISYINYGSWGLQGLYKNDLLGLEFDPLSPDEPKVKGEFVLTNILGIKLDHSKWWDLAAVVIILLTYRIIFYATLKLNERASPFLRAIRAKRILRGLIKSPPVQKIPSFSGKRPQTLHSLSCQEGLNSPIH